MIFHVYRVFVSVPATRAPDADGVPGSAVAGDGAEGQGTLIPMLLAGSPTRMADIGAVLAARQ